VKNDHNDCARDEREEGGEDDVVYNYCLKPKTGSEKVHITVSLWLEPVVIYRRRFTAGSSHKPAMMWIFIIGF
jgi:hypothetical protein